MLVQRAKLGRGKDKAPAEVPVAEQVEQVADYLVERLPFLIASGVAVVLASRLLTGHSLFPKVTTSGPFPWSFMVAGTAFVAHSVYHSIEEQKGASPGDFTALIAIAVSASLFARWGIKLQA